MLLHAHRRRSTCSCEGGRAAPITAVPPATGGNLQSVCLRTSSMEPTSVRRPLRTAAALVGAVALLTACGGSDSGESASSSSASSSSASSPASSESSPASSSTSSGTSSESEPAAEAVITISDFEYSVPDAVPAGAEITVTNEDDVGHTVTADEGDTFDVQVGPGETKTFTAPESAGEYAFHCTPHPAMTSTLVVE